MTIATDNVDPELVAEAADAGTSAFIRNFHAGLRLAQLGFDFVTFGILLWVLHAPPELFRTAWFVESLLTELAIVLVVRTYRPFYRSKPGRMLWISTVVMVLITVILPYLPGAGFFDLVPLSPSTLAILILITLLYVAASEVGKRLFYGGRAKPQVST